MIQKFILTLTLLFVCAQPATASAGGDLFSNQYTGQPTASNKGDIFPTPAPYALNTDMFGQSTPPPPLVHDLFSTRRSNVPPTPLYSWPPDKK